MKRTLPLILGVLIFAVGWWFNSPESPHRQEYVNVYNWYGVIPREVIKQFESETGIKVRYDLYDNNETLETKLLATNAGYDVVFPSISPYLGRGIKAGLYQEIDYSKLSNQRYLDPNILKYAHKIDPELDYCIPYYWGTIGIAYAEEKIKEIMPDAPIDSVRILMDPKILSKFKKCGVSFMEEYTDVLPFAFMHLGIDPDSEKPEDLKKIDSHLMSLRPYIQRFSSTRFIQDLASGQTCLAVAWSGEAQLARDLAKEEKTGLTIKYSVFKEGTILWMDVIAIPKGAPNVDNAYKFINFLLRPTISAKITSMTNISTANGAAKLLLKKKLQNDPYIYPPKAVLDKLYLNKVYSMEMERNRNRAWTKFRFKRAS